MIDLYSENIQKRAITKHILKLNEIYYLRLILHEFSHIQICDFLNLNPHTYNIYKKRIKRKLGCKTFTRAIIEAFRLNILDKYDFINPLIKNQAIIYTDTIFKIVNAQKTYGSKEITNIRDIIIEFNDSCEKVLLTKSGISLTQEETHYLKNKFENINSKLSMVLLPEKKVFLESQIFQKLQTRIWFNAYRKVFNYGILKRLEYAYLNISIEALMCTSKILSLQSQTSFDSLIDKEKKSMIYFQLINFRNIIEYTCLLKNP